MASKYLLLKRTDTTEIGLGGKIQKALGQDQVLHNLIIVFKVIQSK